MQDSTRAARQMGARKSVFPSSDDQSQEGVTLVEFALGLPIFLLLSLGLLLLLWVSWTTMSMNFAIAKAARWGVVGTTLVDPGTGQPMSRLDSFVSRFEEEARRFGVATNDVTLRICPAATPNCAVNTLGNSGSMILVQAQKPSINILGAAVLVPSCSVFLLNE